MAVYEIKAPDGGTYRIEGPDDADPSAVIAQITGHHARSFDMVGGQAVPTGSAAAQAARDPSAGGGTLRPFGIDTGIPTSQGAQRFLSGAGKATTDIVRGIGQTVGLVSRQDVADSRARDAALMRTTAGKAGNITGSVADTLPLALVPGANTLAGSAALGAGMGLLQPSTSTVETLKNTLLGGATAPAALLAGRAVGSLYQGAKAAVKPFLSGGTEEIAGNTLQAFAGGNAIPKNAPAGTLSPAARAAQQLTRAPTTLPGVTPSMGELTDNAGLAQLERTLRNNPETNALMTAQDQTNRAAMTTALERMTGTPAQRATNVGLRNDFAKPFYERAAKTQVEVDPALNKILTRPSMEKAWARAEQLAAENDDKLIRPQMMAAMGRPIPIPGAAPIIDGKALQYLKMGLSDLANTGPQQGMGAHEANALRNTLSDLNGWISNKVPALRQADQVYAWASRPINQADIAGQLREKLVPALGDFGSVPRVNANSFANAVRNGDQIAADVTGRSGATLEGTLNPQQSTTIRQIGEQLARRANASDLGRAVGSNTAQNLAGQNVLRQFLGPLGLPESTLGRAASSVIGKSVARPYGWIAQAAEPDVLQHLARASLNPQYAAKLLTRTPNGRIAQAIWARQGILGPLGTTAGIGILGSGYAPEQ